MILEPNERSIGRIDEEIPDEALLTRARGYVEDAEARDRGTNFRDVLVSEELIAAADREDRGAALDRPP